MFMYAMTRSAPLEATENSVHARARRCVASTPSGIHQTSALYVVLLNKQCQSYTVRCIFMLT
jgi:hypothetical protein